MRNPFLHLVKQRCNCDDVGGGQKHDAPRAEEISEFIIVPDAEWINDNAAILLQPGTSGSERGFN